MMYKNKKQVTTLLVFVGTILEWYDFSVFIFLGPIFAELFFPNNNRIASYLSLYGVFAVSFLIRPLGALFFGTYGDKFGRKKSLILSMNLISISTIAIGLLPSYQKIGILAPILLVFFRLIQGFCVGGETTGAASFVIETFPEKYRGALSSFVWSAVGIGMLLGSIISSYIITLSYKNLYEIGWRLPFFIAVITLLIANYFKKNIPETELFLNFKKRQVEKIDSSIATLFNNKKNLLIIIGLYSLSSVITYLVFIFMPIYASTILKLSFTKVSFITTLAIACVTLGVPFSGFLSDKIGRKPCLYLGAVGFSILGYPLYRLMSIYNSMLVFIIAEIIFVFMAIIYQGVLTSATQELPSTEARYRVTSLGYNVSYALFGGTAPFVVTYFSEILDSKVMPGIYLFVVGFLAILSLANMRETNKKILI